MSFEDVIIPLLLIVPILFVTISYMLFNLYIDKKKEQDMVFELSENKNEIIDTKQKRRDISEDSTLAKKLYFAGFENEFAEYIFMAFSSLFAALLAAFIYMWIDSMIVILPVFLVSVFLPLLVINKIIANRIEEFNYGLNMVIEKITSMMRSGASFDQSFKKAIQTNKSKFTKEILDIYIKEKDIIGEEKAFMKMFKYVESKELRIFYLTISIGKSTGGKFSNTLDTLKSTLKDQGTIKREIVSSTREVKIGTYLIIALTAGIFVMMDNVFSGALTAHFFGSTEGKIQMFFICLWVMFGLFVNNAMTKVKK